MMEEIGQRNHRRGRRREEKGEGEREHVGEEGRGRESLRMNC